MAASHTACRLRLAEATVSLIRGLYPDIRKKIKAGLEAAAKNPDAGKPLRLELAGLRSFRVGRFRIVYRMAAKGVLEVVAVGPRKTIYEETYRRLMRKAP